MRFESALAVPPERFWEHAASIAGVNRELWPIRMSSPRGARLDASTPLGVPLFRSVVSVLGVLPLDVHELALESFDPGRGFVERSRTLIERSWMHARTISPAPGGCTVVDELELEPRFAAPLVAAIVRRVFERRHRRLARMFG
jgi:hypothetical protein